MRSNFAKPDTSRFVVAKEICLCRRPKRCEGAFLGPRISQWQVLDQSMTSLLLILCSTYLPSGSFVMTSVLQVPEDQRARISLTRIGLEKLPTFKALSMRYTKVVPSIATHDWDFRKEDYQL